MRGTRILWRMSMGVSFGCVWMKWVLYNETFNVLQLSHTSRWYILWLQLLKQREKTEEIRDRCRSVETLFSKQTLSAWHIYTVERVCVWGGIISQARTRPRPQSKNQGVRSAPLIYIPHYVFILAVFVAVSTIWQFVSTLLSETIPTWRLELRLLDLMLDSIRLG